MRCTMFFINRTRKAWIAAPFHLFFIISRLVVSLEILENIKWIEVQRFLEYRLCFIKFIMLVFPLRLYISSLILNKIGKYLS
jgi:hypothetical protein